MSNEPMRDKNGNILTSSGRDPFPVQDEMYTHTHTARDHGRGDDSGFSFPSEMIAFPRELVELSLEDLTERIKARRHDARVPRLTELAEKAMFVPYAEGQGFSCDAGIPLQISERIYTLQLTHAEAVRLRAIGELLAVFDGDEIAQKLAGSIAHLGNLV